MKKIDFEAWTTFWVGALFTILLVGHFGCSEEPAAPPVDLRKFNDSVMAEPENTVTTLPIDSEMKVIQIFNESK